MPLCYADVIRQAGWDGVEVPILSSRLIVLDGDVLRIPTHESNVPHRPDVVVSNQKVSIVPTAFTLPMEPVVPE